MESPSEISPTSLGGGVGIADSRLKDGNAAPKSEIANPKSKIPRGVIFSETFAGEERLSCLVVYGFVFLPLCASEKRNRRRLILSCLGCADGIESAFLFARPHFCIDICIYSYYNFCVKRLIPYPASPEIERKLTLKHGVDFSEVEELFANDPLIVRGETDRYGERRYTALGQTYEGRYLMAVFTRPKPGRAKVITARDMTDRQYKLYKRKK